MLQGYARAYKKNLERGKRRRNKYVSSPVKSLVKDVAYLKGLINTEFKYHDYASNNDLSATVINAINFVNEGSSDQTHDGSTFRIKSIQLKGHVSLGGTAANPIAYRLALVLDKDAACATTAPTYSDIFDSSGDSWNALRNLDNRSRFTILKIWDGSLSPNGTEMHRFNFYKKCNILSQIVGTASEANLRKNGLYVVMTSSTGTASLIYMNVVSRIRFVDN